MNSVSMNRNDKLLHFCRLHVKWQDMPREPHTLIGGPSVPLESGIKGLDEDSPSLKSLVASSSPLFSWLFWRLAVPVVPWVVVEALDEALVTDRVGPTGIMLFLVFMALRGIISRSDVKDFESEIPEETEATSSSWLTAAAVSSLITLLTSPFSVRFFFECFLSFFWRRFNMLVLDDNASFAAEPKPRWWLLVESAVAGGVVTASSPSSMEVKLAPATFVAMIGISSGSFSVRERSRQNW